MKAVVLVLGLAISFLFCNGANATLTTNAGMIYSMVDHALSHAETVQALKAFNTVSLDVGYAGDSDEVDHRIIGAVSLDLESLKLGKYIQLPILELVTFKPGMYIGAGNINMQNLDGVKIDWGFSATVISYKF